MKLFNCNTRLFELIRGRRLSGYRYCRSDAMQLTLEMLMYSRFTVDAFIDERKNYLLQKHGHEYEGHREGWRKEAPARCVSPSV